MAKHPFKKGDFLRHIEETRTALLKKTGGALGPAAVKEKAKEVFDKLNKQRRFGRSVSSRPP